MQIEPPQFTKKQLRLQWTNSIVQIHDLICKCDKPLEHTIQNIFDQEKHLRFDNNTIQHFKKWLPTTTADAGETAEDALDIIDGGGLDALFADDFTEEDG